MASRSAKSFRPVLRQELGRAALAPSGRDILSVLLCTTLLTASIMPAVPDPTDPITLTLLAVGGLTLFAWAGRCSHERYIPLPRTGIWLLIFLALVGISLVTASTLDTPFDLWWRGVVPFLFLIFFFPAYSVALIAPRRVLDSLYLSCLTWLAMTALASWDSIPALLQGDALRITHITGAWGAYQLPYALCGLALSLFSAPSWASVLRWPFAALFTLTPVLAVSRGQVIAVAAIWLAYLINADRVARTQSNTIVTLTSASLVGSLIGLIALTSLGGSLMARFGNLQEELGGSRSAELIYSFERFLERPIFGHGMGHLIPPEITFAGQWDVITEAGGVGVLYMHNIIGYLLMNLGISGLAAYSGMVISAVHRGNAWLSRDQSAWRRASLTVLASLLWWSMCSPTFRHIQSVLILSCVMAVLASLRHPSRQSSHA